MLEISNLVKSFAGERARKGGSQGARVYAVNDVSLQVEKGEMFTLLGPRAVARPPPCAPLPASSAPTRG